MNKKLMEYLTNPIKFKLLTTINNQKRATTKELAEIVSQLPQTTLYRYLKKMVDDGLIHIVEENRIRNVNEKVYGMAIDFEAELDLIAKDPSSAASIAQIQRFANGIVDEFEKNLPQGDINPMRDGYGFFIAPIHVSRDEAKELIEKIIEIVKPYESNKVTPDRHLQSWAMVLTPPSKPCSHSSN
ncbi:MAG: winged helix-turn-helix transcriptional regulator [Defluviitaleaceae bacterium]|nr:winged helix-turn-helix transcriptional regulator [Defluviitaleaceae bacterium]